MVVLQDGGDGGPTQAPLLQLQLPVSQLLVPAVGRERGGEGGRERGGREGEREGEREGGRERRREGVHVRDMHTWSTYVSMAPSLCQQLAALSQAMGWMVSTNFERSSNALSLCPLCQRCFIRANVTCSTGRVGKERGSKEERQDTWQFLEDYMHTAHTHGDTSLISVAPGYRLGCG